uniref:glutaryl-CoA dehydrogenase (ETF) n=1 Tax=viral metagenome TaxID=1070528 RepID=A0A6C0F8C7_9ZZZZ|tara:strand:- start:14547 stop:15692 length:1146 start_codon:yes stop_codon:yes gene_type:complete
MINILRINRNLTETQKLVIESVKSFCKAELKPRVIKDYKDEVVDKKIFKKFGEMGIFAPTIKGYGCLGDSYKTYGLIAKEIEAVDSGYRSMFSVQSSLVMGPIYDYGNKTLKEKYLPKLSSGEYVGCFGLTEPDFGSDPSSMRTKAIKCNDHYILNGNKTWISNSPIADVFVVWAKQDEQVKGFILDRSMEGITTPKIEGKMSLRTSVTGMINLDDVKVPLGNALDVNGMRGPFSCLNNARLGISFGVLGSAEYCIEKSIEYSLNRRMFGQSLAEKQLLQMKLANMTTEYNLALLSCLHVADNVDKKQFTPEMISLIKRNSCQKSLEIVRTCRDILGGNGISEEYEIFRHLCNLETVNTYEGTFDIHSLILGNYLTEKKAF